MLYYIGINRTEAEVRTPVAALQTYSNMGESGLSAAIGADNDCSAAARGFLELG